MYERKKRSKARKAKIKKKLRNPLVRKLLIDEMKREAATEIYRLDDDGTGKPLFLNISAMREWAEKNCEIFGMPIDFDRAMQLYESGAIDKDHIMAHTVRNKLEPIIFCQGLAEGDQIVDGAHRFFAMCAGAAMFKIEPSIPGYVLQPEDWRPFVISESVANACGFKSEG